MSWATIIAQIIAVLGPVLSDLLKRWLDSKLKAAAKGLGDPAQGDVEDSRFLLTMALSNTPRRQVMRRAFLRHAIESVPGSLSAGKLNSADRKELAALAAAADGE